MLLAYALAFAQRTGEVVADTKVHLYVAPARFLHDLFSVWSPTADLGHVWGGQYNGYLLPMAPWFAAGDALGLPVWVVHRLWLGTLLAVAALGAWAVAREFAGRSTPAVAAGVLYIVNPYVTVYANRTSVALLAYAALPWMLICVRRGLADPRGWRWPATGALVLALTGGGVNAAVTGWVLLAPALLVVYEVALRGRQGLWSWGWRSGLCLGLANAWWVVPLGVHAKHGLDFLPFTEQPGTIWGTSSLPEALRLMGFWTSYVGVGFGGHLYPFAGQGVLLFSDPIVLASLLVPGLILLSLGRTRSLPSVPFFALLVVAGLLAMVAGWPEGTPLRRGLTFVYNHVDGVRFLRTTYKAGPLVALGLAVMAAAALATFDGIRRTAVGTVGALLVVLAAWPLVTGRALERQLQFAVPRATQQQADQLGRTAASRSRAWVVPGQLFAFSRYGGTIDELLPALTDRPVTSRYIVPFADLRSTELQWATDALLTQERLVPGQLRPLLELQGVGDLVTAADRDRARGGNLGLAETVRQLRGQGLAGGRPFGPVGSTAAAPERLQGAVRTAQYTDRRLGGRMLTAVPRNPLTVIDGGATGLTGLAAFGALDPSHPYAYAPDLSRAQLQQAAATGATFVFTDGNRRQAFVAARQLGDRGAVLTVGDTVSQDGTMLNPFADAGADAQTVAVVRGVKRLDAPASPQVTQFPEHRPFAALDGDPATAWLADRVLAEDRHHLDVDFQRPRAVTAIDLLPYSDSRGLVKAVKVNGRRFAVRPGWNHLTLNLRRATGLSILIAEVQRPERASAGAGGIRELRIPGVSVTEALRTPRDLSAKLRGADLSRARIDLLLNRFTGPQPYVRGAVAGAAQAGLVRDARDPELQLRRIAELPDDRRAYRAEAWTRPAVTTSDAELDTLAGVTGDLRVDGSARYEGLPRHRASGAFDGGAPGSSPGAQGRDWIASWVGGRRAWLSWTWPRAHRLKRLRLTPPSVRVRRPTRVRLEVDGVGTPVLDVAPDGLVSLPTPLTGRTVRLTVVGARFPAGTPERLKQRRAVGIGEVRAAGLPRLDVPRGGALDLPCGAASVAVGRTRVDLGGTVPRAALDAGRPLPLSGCTRPSMGGTTTIRGLRAPLVVDQLRLDGPSPQGLTVVPADTTPAVVLRDGTLDGEGLRHAAIRVSSPSYLVFGQSYEAGWRARCDGRDLGAPRPLQGYANAWPLGAPGCRNLDITYSPQKAVDRALTLSLISAPFLLLLALWPRRRRRPAVAPDAPAAPDAVPVRLPPGRALAWGLLAGAVGGFVFALRAGVVIGPATAFILWRAVSDRALLWLAGVLLVVAVPLSYLLTSPTDDGGYDTAYATQHITAHWLAVGGLVALLFVLGRRLRTARAHAAGGRGSAPSAPRSRQTRGGW